MPLVQHIPASCGSYTHVVPDATSSPDSRFTINSPQVVSDFVDGEVVAVNLESGTYFALYGVSALVWEALTQGVSQQEIHDRLDVDDHRRADAAADLDAFVGLLLHHDLLRSRSDQSDTDGAAALEAVLSVAWEPLQLHVHSDLQDILLLDPVHDTTESGWPEARVDDPQAEQAD